VLMEKGDKFLKFAGFLSKITGGSDQRGEFGDRDTTESRGGKQTIAAQGDNGALNVSPSGVLGEDGADDDFEAGPCGPPFLRSVGSKEELVILLQNGRGCSVCGDGRTVRTPEIRVGTLRGGCQTTVFIHHFRKIDTQEEQVKKEELYCHPRACTAGQVLANSQLWFKIEPHPNALFAMLTVGSQW
jgi:hypothetical protein